MNLDVKWTERGAPYLVVPGSNLRLLMIPSVDFLGLPEGIVGIFEDKNKSYAAIRGYYAPSAIEDLP